MQCLWARGLKPPGEGHGGITAGEIEHSVLSCKAIHVSRIMGRGERCPASWSTFAGLLCLHFQCGCRSCRCLVGVQSRLRSLGARTALYSYCSHRGNKHRTECVVAAQCLLSCWLILILNISKMHTISISPVRREGLETGIGKPLCLG